MAIVKICTSSELSLDATFSCGQCFRWNKNADGRWRGIVAGRALSAYESGGSVYIDTGETDVSDTGSVLAGMRKYFDLEADYSPSLGFANYSDYMRRAAGFGCGLRLLNQEPFEALISFIISQCNNIPRIKSIIEKLAMLSGKEISPGSFAFPEPRELASLTSLELEPLRAGYRTRYIIAAAEAVAGKKLIPEEVSRLSFEDAMAVLRSLPGVGAKVACCALLYGFGFKDAFPIDTWMKKALSRHFSADFSPEVFAPLRGLAQQYIFYYERSASSGGFDADA